MILRVLAYNSLKFWRNRLSVKIADAAPLVTASLGKFLVFDTKTTCIFLHLDTKSCFATPISDFNFIWSFSPPLYGLALFGCGTRFPIHNAHNHQLGIPTKLQNKGTTKHCQKFEIFSMIKIFKICLNSLEIVVILSM